MVLLSASKPSLEFFWVSFYSICKESNYGVCHKKPESISAYKNIHLPLFKSDCVNQVPKMFETVNFWAHSLAHGAFSGPTADKRLGNLYQF